MKIALDFAPGMHGHFLEYVLNRYIFKIPTVKQTIFQSSGACHPINTDADYMTNKLVHKLHYSAYDHPYPEDATQVIFVKHDPKLDFLLLTNIFHRCNPASMQVDDFNIEEIKKLHLELMGSAADASPQAMRSNWYAKLMERHFPHTERLPITDLPVFDFDFASFFALGDFLEEINSAAKFLNHSFSFDNSLVILYNEFIERNQGYHAYQQGNKLFEHIAAGDSVTFESDWQLQAYLNTRLSQVFGLYDQPELFFKDTYPTDTLAIHAILMDHIENFDNRF